MSWGCWADRGGIGGGNVRGAGEFDRGGIGGSDSKGGGEFCRWMGCGVDGFGWTGCAHVLLLSRHCEFGRAKQRRTQDFFGGEILGSFFPLSLIWK